MLHKTNHQNAPAIAPGSPGRRSPGNRLRAVLRLLVLVMLVGLSATLPAARAAVPPGYAPVGLGDVYLALGDSIATGTEAAGNNDDRPGYPSNLLPLLQRISPDVELVLLARDGETSTSLLAAGGQIDDAIDLIEARRATGERVGLVTLTIGGNDIIELLRRFPADPDTAFAGALEEFEANFATILDRLLAALEDQNGIREGNLLVMDYYNPYPDFDIPGYGELADEWVPQFNAVLREIALARGVPVAEVAQAFAGNEVELLYVQRPYPTSLFEPDLETRLDYHPRPAGHEVIAGEFLAVSGYRLRSHLPLTQVR